MAGSTTVDGSLTHDIVALDTRRHRQPHRYRLRKQHRADQQDHRRRDDAGESPGVGFVLVLAHAYVRLEHRALAGHARGTGTQDDLPPRPLDRICERFGHDERERAAYRLCADAATRRPTSSTPTAWPCAAVDLDNRRLGAHRFDPEQRPAGSGGPHVELGHPPAVDRRRERRARSGRSVRRPASSPRSSTPHLNSWDAIAWDRESNRFYLHRGDRLVLAHLERGPFVHR